MLRIRYPKLKRFTFQQNHCLSYIQIRLDFFFISNTTQAATKSIDILTPLSTDHSPIFFSLSKPSI